MKRRQLPNHGLSRTLEYRAWQQMRLRCLDPEHKHYPDYGGRGITVCERWKDSPANFIADMGSKPTPKHELDRYPNNDGDYEPGNCRWALRTENCRNRRSNRIIECDGESLTLVAWSERSGVRADTIGERLERGWSAHRAIFTPARAKSPKGQLKTYTQPCIECGAQANGQRCRPCENRRRPRDLDTGTFLSTATSARELETA